MTTATRSRKKQRAPGGWIGKLLREAGFTPALPMVDPPSGSRFDIPGTRKDYLKALGDVGDTDILDYHRAANCVVSGGCKKVFDAEAAAFIEGYFYIQHPGENQIERWIPTEETKALRDGFDAGEEPPARFLYSFRAAQGAERLAHRRNTRRKFGRPSHSNEIKGTGTLSQRRVTTLNKTIRNGILIAERIPSA